MNTLTEQELEQQDYWVGLKEASERLHQNPDFKKLVLGAYFNDRAVNAVSALSSTAVVRNGERPSIMEELVAISHFQHFLIMVHNLGYSQVEEDEDHKEVE